MKTVTKEQVKKALNNRTKEDILNELFPPEFKAGEWVIGWHSKSTPDNFHEKAWQIEEIKGKYVYRVGLEGYNTEIDNIRHATPEEIESATWKEGELYRVKKERGWCLRVSANVVGHFYIYGYYDGQPIPCKTYEKIQTCSCGFCVKKKEG
jgi:hypothetical protein